MDVLAAIRSVSPACLTQFSWNGLNRNTEDDDLITQIDVFDEGMSADQEALEGMDINSHRDVFRAVYIKVRSSLMFIN